MAAIQIRIEHGVAEAEVISILDSLPAWFGRPEAIAAYAREAETLDAVVSRHNGTAIGVVTLKPQTPACAELAVMAVRPEWRRRGIGKALIERAAGHLQERGFQLMLVQTLGPSYEDASYAETRAFYEAVGFRPLIEIADHFGDGEPALLMVRPAA